METYKFYMQECDKYGEILEGTNPKDLENDFKIETISRITGQLRYKECKGLNTIGKPRVYTETYADSDRLRSYIPETPLFDATEIELTLYFTGESRQASFDAFNEFILGGYRKYWDTARNKAFCFFVKDKVDISDEKWYGSTPYFEVTYKLQNLKGKTTNV